jgi:hypothetical protein
MAAVESLQNGGCDPGLGVVHVRHLAALTGALIGDPSEPEHTNLKTSAVLQYNYRPASAWAPCRQVASLPAAHASGGSSTNPAIVP